MTAGAWSARSLLGKALGPRMAVRAKTTATTAVLLVAAACVLIPIYWLVVASSKDTSQLFSTNTFLPSHLSWAANFSSLFSYESGDYKWWLMNSFIYSSVTATLATVVSTMAGYGLAKYEFGGRRAAIGLVMGTLMVPATALVVPLFLLEHYMGLTDTYQGVILPLIVYPFGVYFMSIYAAEAVPDALLESARIDGAGEFRALWKVGRPILAPGMATLFLLSFIATWNNYFLPLVLLGTETRFPLTVGLSAWAATLNEVGAGEPLYSNLILGSLISVLPMLVLFPFLQKYVARGLTFGAISGE
ncbi:MAG: carbohydrate ABC transporter permease [Acidimicrobiales bacterium]